MDEIHSEVDRKIETVFKADPPLTKLNEKEEGYGYLGVILRDTLSDTIQCHKCGKWYSNLSTHVSQKHKVKIPNYKKYYELPMSFPLNSISLSNRRSKIGVSQKNIEHIKKMIKEGKWGNNKKYKKNKKYAKNNMAHLNKHSICPEQLNRRYVMLADRLGKEPSLRDLTKYEPNLLATIRRRYKTFNRFKRKNGYQVIKKSPIFSDDKLISKLVEFKDTYHRIPTKRDFENTSPSKHAFIGHFGSWNRALVYAGLL